MLSSLPPRSLPLELLSYVAAYSEQTTLSQLIYASRAFRDAALPWLYYTPEFTSVEQLRQFQRRVPASRGRWIRSIDLSLIAHRWQQLSDKELLAFIMRYATNLDESLLDTSKQNELIGNSRTASSSAIASSHDTNRPSSADNEQPRRLGISDLDICWTPIRDQSLATIVSWCGSSLRQLSVANCYITDIAVIAIAQWCPQLIKLDLTDTEVTDDGIIELAKGCQSLQWLSLQSCEMITDEAVATLRESCPQLRWLDLEGCYGILSEQPTFSAAPNEIHNNTEQLPGHDLGDGWQTEEDTNTATSNSSSSSDNEDN
ncbi:hypothetical protein BDF19DRAFT_448713 [Syncephalis fuscata]|nr:hypothetical protein BDF19DRAFT_448713 [Syncephalis fuscata]